MDVLRGCLTIMLVVVGALLLGPGLCVFGLNGDKTFIVVGILAILSAVALAAWSRRNDS